jgi:trehalose 6-phosphate phosphatase
MPLERPPTSILQSSSLFLDFDGTLVDLASTPDEVQVRDEVRSLLERLRIALGGRIALLSGRAIEDLRRLLHPLEFALAGSHGLERLLSTGQIDAATPPPALPAAIQEFRRIEALHPGVLVEEKPVGVALHYRKAPEAEAICHDAAQRLAGSTGMSVQIGKMVVELKGAPGDKGQGLKRFMNEPPFKGTRPVFLGDDLTDEHAFATARLLGGVGILVGPKRPTAASYRLEDVSDVISWLQRGCEELE